MLITESLFILMKELIRAPKLATRYLGEPAFVSKILGMASLTKWKIINTDNSCFLECTFFD